MGWLGLPTAWFVESNICAGEGEEGEEEGKAKAPGKYTKFWKNYGKPMKLGLIEDSGNRQRIAKLIRWA